MMPEPRIIFGTDGWRGRIADDYTYSSVRRCSHGFARYLLDTDGDGLAVVYNEATGPDVGAVMVESALDAMLGVLISCPKESIPKQHLLAAVEPAGHFTGRTLERAWAALNLQAGVTVSADGKAASVKYFPPDEDKD